MASDDQNAHQNRDGLTHAVIPGIHHRGELSGNVRKCPEMSGKLKISGSPAVK